MKNLSKVITLRKQLLCKSSSISKTEGIYCWWFKKTIAETFVQKLSLDSCEINKIQSRIIEGEMYWALYFGISNNMLARAKWHMLQKHTVSTVKYGTLSTLRQSLSALLGMDMIYSQDKVNALMDDNCYWEWEYCTDSKLREKSELNSESKCYPINIQENCTVRKEVINKLKKMRKEHRTF